MLLFAAISIAQKPQCDLTIDRAPELRLARLGMTPERISQIWNVEIKPRALKTTISLVSNGGKYVLFRDWVKTRNLTKDEQQQARKNLEKAGNLTNHSVEAGESGFQLLVDPNVKQDPKSPLYRVDEVMMRFSDNQVVSISIAYNIKDLGWSNSRDFALSMSEKMNLPTDVWDFTDASEPKMQCRDFYLDAFAMDTLGNITLRDTKRENEKQTSAANAWVQAQEKQKANFKP